MKIPSKIFGSSTKRLSSKTPPWKTFKVGRDYETRDELREAMQRNGCNLESPGDKLFNAHTSCVDERSKTLRLCKISIEELGLPDWATRSRVYEKAIVLGLELCPSEVIPYFRMEYTDQPLGEFLFVGMKPVAVRGDLTLIYHLINYKGQFRVLTAVNGSPHGKYSIIDEFMFVLP